MVPAEAAPVLESVGVNPLEERVYRAIIRQPSVQLSELRALTGLSVPAVRRLLARLVETGLLRPAGTTGTGFGPVSPDLALASLVNQRRAQLDLVQVAAAEFSEEWRTSQLERHPSELVEVVVGASENARHAATLIESAQEELRIFDRPPYVTADEDEVRIEEPLLNKGVRVLSIYCEAAVAAPGKVDRIRQVSAQGEQSRMIAELPIKMVIVDRRVAMVPLTSPERMQSSAVIVHPSGVLDALIALFEMYWTQASPFSVRQPAGDDSHGLTADQAQILPLLAIGVKDEAIAKQVGVSLRTARRRIHQLMQVLHTTTRFQAGAQAVRRGWL